MFRKETLRLWLEIQQKLSKPQTHGMTEKKNGREKKKNITVNAVNAQYLLLLLLLSRFSRVRLWATS